MGVKAQDLYGVDEEKEDCWRLKASGDPKKLPLASLPILLHLVPKAHTPPVGSCYIRGAGLGPAGATEWPD